MVAAGAGGAASGAALSTITPLFIVWLQFAQPLVTTPLALTTLPPQLLHPLETGAGEPQPQEDSTGALHPHDATGAGALHPHDATGAGALHPQDDSTGAGALQPQDGAGAGALQVGAGAQHEGAGEQLDALPHRPARSLANKPACASEAEATTTEQTTRLATKNRLIGTSQEKQFSLTRNAGHNRLVLLSLNSHRRTS